MRNLEFRTWDEEEERFFYTDITAHIQGSGEWARCFWCTDSPHDDYYEHPRTMNTIIEQFTGLLDKNGVKIFEGDIVHCIRMADNNAFEAWTSYDGYDPETKAIPFEIKREGQGIDIDWPCDIRWNPYWWEIIGNIHENPELLND